MCATEQIAIVKSDMLWLSRIKMARASRKVLNLNDSRILDFFFDL